MKHIRRCLYDYGKINSPEDYEEAQKEFSSLYQALTWALEYIDALPSDVVAELPAMPGFDRDYVDELIYEAKEIIQ